MSSQSRMREFFRFCLIGGVGFLVDSAVTNILFFLLAQENLSMVLVARIIGMFVALQATYRLHRVFTFRGQTPHSRRSWVKFMQFNLIGAAINYVVFVVAGTLLARWIMPFIAGSESFYMPLFDANTLLFMIVESAVIAGTIAGLLFNYWANRRFVFPPGEQ